MWIKDNEIDMDMMFADGFPNFDNMIRNKIYQHSRNDSYNTILCERNYGFISLVIYTETIEEYSNKKYIFNNLYIPERVEIAIKIDMDRYRIEDKHIFFNNCVLHDFQYNSNQKNCFVLNRC